MKKLIIAMAVALVATGVMAQEMYWSSADAGPLLRIKNGYAETITVVISSCFNSNSTITISDGTTTKTITASASYDTISELAAEVGAYTNASGKKLLTVDSTCSLPTDSVTGRVYSATSSTSQTNTVTPGQWANALTWDTSTCLFYSTHIPSSKNGGSGISGQIEKLYGDITGTGNITLTGYVENPLTGVMDKKFQKSITSPVYVFDASTTATTLVTVAESILPGQIGSSAPFISGSTTACDWPAYRTGQQAVMVRAARATTATTGGIGLILRKQ